MDRRDAADAHRAAARRAPPGVRFVSSLRRRREIAAFFRRADLVVLPYREIDQSGVLFTALGLRHAAAAQRGRRLPRGRRDRRRRARAARRQGGAALALVRLLADPAARERLAAAARGPRRRALLVGRDRRRPPRPLCEARGVSEWRETNRAWWDERVPIHVAQRLLRRRGVPGRPRRRCDAFEIEEVGDVDGRTLVHLAVPLRPRHALVGPPRRARHGARLLGAGGRGGARRSRPTPASTPSSSRPTSTTPSRRSAAAASTSSTPAAGRSTGCRTSSAGPAGRGKPPSPPAAASTSARCTPSRMCSPTTG